MSALDDLLHQEHTDALDKCILEVWEINGYEYLAEEGLVILADLRSRVAELEAMLSKRNTTLHKQESEIQRLEALTQWQPIETCPEKTDVLILLPSSSGKHIEQAEREGRQYFALYGNMREFRSPTHWMPLPKPPEEK